VGCPSWTLTEGAAGPCVSELAMTMEKDSFYGESREGECRFVTGGVRGGTRGGWLGGGKKRDGKGDGDRGELPRRSN